jgi:hypothetical protein
MFPEVPKACTPCHACPPLVVLSVPDWRVEIDWNLKGRYGGEYEVFEKRGQALLEAIEETFYVRQQKATQPGLSPVDRCTN